MLRLARYFAVAYLGVFLLTLSLLVVLVVAVTLVENAGELTRVDQGGVAALRLAGYSALEYAYQTLPVAAFIAALVAGTQLARRGEVLAVQAAGLGPLHAWGPFVGAVLLVAGLGALAGEYGLPQAVAGRLQLLGELRRLDALTQFYQRRIQWFREGDLMLYLPAVDAAQQSFAEPIVYRVHEGLIAETIEARALRHDATQGWWLEDAEAHAVATPAVVRTPRLALPLHVSPRDLIDITGNPREMRTPEMARLIERRQNAGFDTTAHRVELHTRFSYPAGALCLVLLAVPWALDPERKRSMAGILGVGVVVVALYLCLSQVFRLLALAHKLPPGLGAWGAFVVGLALLPASWLAYQRRRRRGHLF